MLSHESSDQAELDEVTKACRTCGDIKPESAFHRGGYGRRRTICSACRSAARRGNRGETPEQRLKRKLKDEYQLTVAQYEALVAAQGGLCASCNRGPEAGRRLAVDHCHATGVVRALLCTRCNLIVGVFENNHREASEYLAVYGAGNPLLKVVAW
ncbi:endonuclease domain-containing protein [Streptomyces sp. NPDC048211]|uniref:endonuclease domain-containing protein n=1 Tax=Streptomyces sp. NPDC048211 TaxID=3365516 RepID=UPI003711F06C